MLQVYPLEIRVVVLNLGMVPDCYTANKPACRPRVMVLSPTLTSSALMLQAPAAFSPFNFAAASLTSTRAFGLQQWMDWHPLPYTMSSELPTWKVRHVELFKLLSLLGALYPSLCDVRWASELRMPLTCDAALERSFFRAR